MPNIVPKLAEPADHSGREAKLTRDREGDPIGAAIWLNADELAALGIDIESIDSVAYRVSDGDLHIGTSEMWNRLR